MTRRTRAPSQLTSTAPALSMSMSRVRVNRSQHGTHVAGHVGQIPHGPPDRHSALFEPAHVEQVADHLTELFGHLGR